MFVVTILCQESLSGIDVRDFSLVSSQGRTRYETLTAEIILLNISKL